MWGGIVTHDEAEVERPREEALLDEQVGVRDHIRVEGLDLLRARLRVAARVRLRIRVRSILSWLTTTCSGLG